MRLQRPSYLFLRAGLVLVLGIPLCVRSAAQSSAEIVRSFEQASAEFGVPSDILKGISFAETRWSHVTWAPGDTVSCIGLHHPYGIMSLRDDDFMGHSLRLAANLIAQSPEVLKADMRQNVRGAAALLRWYYVNTPLPEGTNAGSLESWRNAIARYSGLPTPALAQQHALDIYTQMAKGYHGYHINWDARAVDLGAIRAAVKKTQLLSRDAIPSGAQSSSKVTAQPDYPLAKWAQAYPGHWYTSGYPKNFVVEHDMEDYYLPVIAYFQQSSTEASVFYCVNGLKDDSTDAPAGEITQMVEEKYWAWHVRCWNTYMFGTEHEGFVSNPAWYTDTLYRSSARLTAYLCAKYSIPVDRDHIIGHDEWQNSAWVSWIYNVYNPLLRAQGIPAIDPTCNDHTDPGPYWNWTYYMQLVNSYMPSPRVVSVSPQVGQGNVRLYRPVVMAFSTAMDSGSTIASFSITPPISGSFEWNGSHSVLTFIPSALFSPSMVYAVKVDTSAKSISLATSIGRNGDGIGGSAYQFSFTTESAPPSTISLLRSYPHDNETGVSSYSDLCFVFSNPLNALGINSRLSLQDSAGNPVQVTGVTVDSLDDKGFLTVTPASLNFLETYRARIFAGVQDLYGNMTAHDTSIQFITSGAGVSSGIIFDTFESNARQWQQPSAAANSKFIDTNLTFFAISTDRKKSGNSAGKLQYGFSQSSQGVVDLSVRSRPSLDAYNELGVWIYGDLSGNSLSALFQPSNQSIALGPIDWHGWKFVTVSLADINGPDKLFSDFVITQSDSGFIGGTLYFDDMQVNATTTGVPVAAAQEPDAFGLGQNYPNPFNPTTAISYQLPAVSFVRLVVFDIQGRQIAILVDGMQGPGQHQAVWIPGDAPSGTYFYRLQTDRTVETKKMVLIR